MDEEEMTEARADELKVAWETLEKAVFAYYGVVEPDSFVTNWLLLSHKESTQMAEVGVSSVGRVGNQDQNWVTTLGLVKAVEHAVLSELS